MVLIYSVLIYFVVQPVLLVKVLPTIPFGGHHLKSSARNGGHAGEERTTQYGGYKASTCYDVTVTSSAEQQCNVTKTVIGQKGALLSVARYNHRRSFTTDDVDIGLCKGLYIHHSFIYFIIIIIIINPSFFMIIFHLVPLGFEVYRYSKISL